jgi:tRNA(Ile)-lysidine synthase
LAHHARRFGFELFAHGVDHGLRPEAGAELDLAEQLATRCRVSFSRSRVTVGHGANLQARARTERYAALARAAQAAGAKLIATAHHADDRAETVLIRLLRGAGPQGLSVLSPRSGSLIRPLVRARRSDVLVHLGRHEIRYAEDPTNRDRRYLRARVRYELLPLLEELSPQIVRHLNALADALGGGPPPVVLDEAGRPLVLGRAHLLELKRAVDRRSTRARVRLPGGREIRLDPATRHPVVVVEHDAKPPAGRR